MHFNLVAPVGQTACHGSGEPIQRHEHFVVFCHEVQEHFAGPITSVEHQGDFVHVLTLVVVHARAVVEQRKGVVVPRRRIGAAVTISEIVGSTCPIDTEFHLPGCLVHGPLGKDQVQSIGAYPKLTAPEFGSFGSRRATDVCGVANSRFQTQIRIKVAVRLGAVLREHDVAVVSDDVDGHLTASCEEVGKSMDAIVADERVLTSSVVCGGIRVVVEGLWIRASRNGHLARICVDTQRKDGGILVRVQAVAGGCSIDGDIGTSGSGRPTVVVEVEVVTTVRKAPVRDGRHIGVAVNHVRGKSHVCGQAPVERRVNAKVVQGIAHHRLNDNLTFVFIANRNDRT